MAIDYTKFPPTLPELWDEYNYNVSKRTTDYIKESDWGLFYSIAQDKLRTLINLNQFNIWTTITWNTLNATAKELVVRALARLLFYYFNATDLNIRQGISITQGQVSVSKSVPTHVEPMVQQEVINFLTQAGIYNNAITLNLRENRLIGRSSQGVGDSLLFSGGFLPSQTVLTVSGGNKRYISGSTGLASDDDSIKIESRVNAYGNPQFNLEVKKQALLVDDDTVKLDPDNKAYATIDKNYFDKVAEEYRPKKLYDSAGDMTVAGIKAIDTKATTNATNITTNTTNITSNDTDITSIKEDYVKGTGLTAGTGISVSQGGSGVNKTYTVANTGVSSLQVSAGAGISVANVGTSTAPRYTITNTRLAGGGGVAVDGDTIKQNASSQLYANINNETWRYTGGSNSQAFMKIKNATAGNDQYVPTTLYGEGIGSLAGAPDPSRYVDWGMIFNARANITALQNNYLVKLNLRTSSELNIVKAGSNANETLTLGINDDGDTIGNNASGELEAKLLKVGYVKVSGRYAPTRIYNAGGSYLEYSTLNGLSTSVSTNTTNITNLTTRVNSLPTSQHNIDDDTIKLNSSSELYATFDQNYFSKVSNLYRPHTLYSASGNVSVGSLRTAISDISTIKTTYVPQANLKAGAGLNLVASGTGASKTFTYAVDTTMFIDEDRITSDNSWLALVKNIKNGYQELLLRVNPQIGDTLTQTAARKMIDVKLAGNQGLVRLDGFKAGGGITLTKSLNASTGENNVEVSYTGDAASFDAKTIKAVSARDPKLEVKGFRKSDGSLETSATILSNIAANKAKGNTNATSITNNARDIRANDTDIAANTVNITTNTTGIATNVSNIALNTTARTTNATNIATNRTAIALNTTARTNNATAIATINTNLVNKSEFKAGSGLAVTKSTTGTNTVTYDLATATKTTLGRVATNATNIATNTTNITANTTARTTNTTNITTNRTNLATLTSNALNKDTLVGGTNVSLSTAGAGANRRITINSPQIGYDNNTLKKNAGGNLYVDVNSFGVPTNDRIKRLTFSMPMTNAIRRDWPSADEQYLTTTPSFLFMHLAFTSGGIRRHFDKAVYTGYYDINGGSAGANNVPNEYYIPLAPFFPNLSAGNSMLVIHYLTATNRWVIAYLGPTIAGVGIRLEVDIFGSHFNIN